MCTLALFAETCGWNRSVLDLELVRARDGLGRCRDAVREVGDEVVVSADVERPEVNVCCDEPSTIVGPEQIRIAPVA